VKVIPLDPEIIGLQSKKRKKIPQAKQSNLPILYVRSNRMRCGALRYRAEPQRAVSGVNNTYDS